MYTNQESRIYAEQQEKERKAGTRWTQKEEEKDVDLKMLGDGK